MPTGVKGLSFVVSLDNYPWLRPTPKMVVCVLVGRGGWAKQYQNSTNKYDTPRKLPKQGNFKKGARRDNSYF